MGRAILRGLIAGLALAGSAAFGQGAGTGEGTEAAPPAPPGPPGPTVLFTNVDVFDGVSATLVEDAHVLVEGRQIAAVSTMRPEAPGARVIDGGGRVLMPGLIDGHTHLALWGNPVLVGGNMHWAYVGTRTAVEAEKMLMRGFTTVRDAGGPVQGVARAIDEGLVPGPRIFPSGPFITQTSGHFDFRLYNDAHPRQRADATWFEREWAFIADGPDEVRAMTREALRRGATQIKLSLGGGSSSPWDPLDTVHYSTEEIRAAVEAAADWGTYVMVHAYSDASVLRALEAGVKSIEHGNLIAERATLRAVREAGAALVPQALIFSPAPDQMAQTDPAKLAKGAPIRDNLDRFMTMVREEGVEIAFGVDSFGTPGLLAAQNRELTRRLRWFSAAEVLRQATSVTGRVVAMSGPRNPYPEGPLGVIAPGAYADLLIVDGDPLEDLSLLEDPQANLVLIMKDGKIYRNALD